MKIKNKKLSFVLGGLLVSTSIHSSPGALSEDRVRIGNFILPPFFSRALSEGLSVPIYLRYIDAPTQAQTAESPQRQKIGDAILYYDQKLYIKEITLIELEKGTQLSEQTKSLLQAIKKQAFQDHTQFKISEHAELQLDLKTLNLELIVEQEALAVRSIARQNVLGQSSSQALTSVLNYRTGSYFNQYDDRSNSSSYLNLDQIWAYREHHLSLNGAVYGIGANNTETKLYRAIYEHDRDGYRFSAGLMDTWNLQSIVSMSALSVDKLYAFSYGNQSYTLEDDQVQSLIPIVVFLPTAGSVQIYRDGRLLSIQEMPMGSNEIDTTRFPYGIYNVQIKTLIDGQETAHSTAQINKTFGRRSSVMGKLSWQVFAGMLDYREYLDLQDTAQFDAQQFDSQKFDTQQYDTHQPDRQQLDRLQLDRHNRNLNLGAQRRGMNPQLTTTGVYAQDELGDAVIDPSAPWINSSSRMRKTWLAGVAGSISLPWLSGTTLKSTLYGFDQSYINESEVNISLNQSFSANQQLMWASDRSWRSSSSLNYQLPKGWGSLWAIREYSAIGDQLEINQQDSYGIGGSLNLKSMFSPLGYLSMSYNRDQVARSVYRNLDYHQNIFNSRYASVSLRTGLQFDQQKDQLFADRKDKYVYLEAKIPLSTRVSAGVTRQNKNTVGDLSYRQDFDRGVIRSVGLSLSNNFSQDSSAANTGLDELKVNATSVYSTKYNQGNVSYSHNGSSNSSLTLTSQGSIAIANNAIALGKETQTSGIMINTNLADQGELMAQINGQQYALSGKNNFIALAPFKQYSVELMNAKDSRDSVNIVSGRHTQVTLYPGNVGVLKPQIKEMVTVFGRIVDQNGQAAAHKQIHNHIGKTQTDQLGAFVMDIDKRYPIINLIEPNGTRCESKVNLKGARGAIWVGALQCKPIPASTAPSLFEVRE